jgi:hypothetical protein
MSISLVIAALQTRNAAITGIAKAPTAYPGSLNTAHLPLVLVWPAASQSHQNSIGDLRRSDRTYNLDVYVAPVAQGQGVDQEIQNSITLLQRFIDAYANAEDSDLIGGSPQATIKASEQSPIQDTGIVVLKYAGTDYHGFRLQVGVYEKW